MVKLYFPPSHNEIVEEPESEVCLPIDEWVINFPYKDKLPWLNDYWDKKFQANDLYAGVIVPDDILKNVRLLRNHNQIVADDLDALLINGPARTVISDDLLQFFTGIFGEIGERYALREILHPLITMGLAKEIEIKYTHPYMDCGWPVGEFENYPIDPCDLIVRILFNKPLQPNEKEDGFCYRGNELSLFAAVSFKHQMPYGLTSNVLRIPLTVEGAPRNEIFNSMSILTRILKNPDQNFWQLLLTSDYTGLFMHRTWDALEFISKHGKDNTTWKSLASFLIESRKARITS